MGLCSASDGSTHLDWLLSIPPGHPCHICQQTFHIWWCPQRPGVSCTLLTLLSSVWTRFHRAGMQPPSALPAAEGDILSVLCWMGTPAPWMIFEAFRAYSHLFLSSCKVKEAEIRRGVNLRGFIRFPTALISSLGFIWRLEAPAAPLHPLSPLGGC